MDVDKELRGGDVLRQQESLLEAAEPQQVVKEAPKIAVLGGGGEFETLESTLYLFAHSTGFDTRLPAFYRDMFLLTPGVFRTPQNIK